MDDEQERKCNDPVEASMLSVCSETSLEDVVVLGTMSVTVPRAVTAESGTVNRLDGTQAWKDSIFQIGVFIWLGYK